MKYSTGHAPYEILIVTIGIVLNFLTVSLPYPDLRVFVIGQMTHRNPYGSFYFIRVRVYRHFLI